jgi:8-oxo-dGDP phosphatase
VADAAAERAANLRALRDGLLADVVDPQPIVRSEVPFRGRVWDIRRDVVRFGDGEIVREYMDHPGAVAVLAVDADERVLLINQYRHPISRRDWELPAGLLDVEGEDPLTAAQRELAEEVDLVAGDWSRLATFHTSPGGSDELLQVFLARDLGDSPEPFARADEEAEIVSRWVPLDEAVAAVLDGRLTNSILMIAVLAAHARRG